MSVYLIEHPTEKFTGYFGGVDFHRGRGSTSSRADARKLAGFGYRVSERGTMTAKQGTEAEGGAPAASPADFTPTPEELAAVAKREREHAALDAAERNPDSPGQKRRKQEVRDIAAAEKEAREKAAHGRRRKR